MSSGLLALGSAAVLVVYSAGYWRTKAAAARFAEALDRPRPGIPSAPEFTPRPPDAPPSAPAAESTNGAGAPGASSGAASTSPASSAPVRVTTSESKTATHAVSAAAPPSKPTNDSAPAAAASVDQSASASSAATAAAPSSSASGAPIVATPATATPPVEAPRPPDPPPPPAPQWKDGTYTGWGTSRHGDIQATVVIESGRISSALISQCLTRYSCSWVAHLQGQVVTRQSPEVDYVSGATQSTNAFYYAVVEALAKAKQ